jgi:CRP-like cAMP-binding protein
MYIIESGAAIVSDYADESNQQSLISKATGGLIPFTILPKEIRLQSRGYFGEEALLLDEEDLDVGEKPSRKATITAAPDSGCVCLVLNRDVFDRVLRKIKHRFYRNIIARDAEFLALVEKGQKEVHEVEAETWERHRSGKYSAPAASLNYEQGHDDNDDEENVAKLRRAAEQVTRRLSVRRPAPSTPAQGKAQAQAHAQSQKRRKVANHGAKDAVGVENSSTEGQVEHEESNWLNGVFCGVGV